MNFQNKQLKKIMDRMKAGIATDEDKIMYKKLSLLSGMRGAEKSLKDRIGKSLNLNNKHDVMDKINKKIMSSIDKNKDNK